MLVQFPPCATGLSGRRFGTSTKTRSSDHLPYLVLCWGPERIKITYYLKEEKKSPRNSSSRSLQTRDTNYILFCQKWTCLLTALGNKDHINYQDVGLNVARIVLFWVTFLITRHLIDCIHIFNYIYHRVLIVFRQFLRLNCWNWKAGS